MAIDARILGSEEWPVLDHAAPGVFDRPIDQQLARRFLADPRHHLAVALDGHKVVGMASAVDYVHPDKPVELWINEIGVAPEYRRAGIGRKLLAALCDLGRQLGCREAWVVTEPDHEAAGALYASAGGREAPGVIYSFRLDGDTGA